MHSNEKYGMHFSGDDWWQLKKVLLEWEGGCPFFRYMR